MSLSGNFCGGIRSLPSSSVDGILYSSGSGIMGGQIRSTPDRVLTSLRSWDGLLQIFDVANSPRWGLSSRVSLMRRLHHSFSNSPVLFLCADHFVRYVLLSGLKNISSCSVGDPCSPRIFHFVIPGSNCLHLGINLYSQFQGINFSVFWYSSPENFYFGSLQNFSGLFSGRTVPWTCSRMELNPLMLYRRDQNRRTLMW